MTKHNLATKSPTQRLNKAKLFALTVPPSSSCQQEQYNPVDIFGSDAREPILNALESWLGEWREADTTIQDIGHILPGLPDGEGITLKNYYLVLLRRLERERSLALRHIKRLQQQYDQVFGTSHFAPPPNNSSVDIETLKDRTDIIAIVSEYLPLRKAGARHVGLCPFHQEKTPSFTVFEDHYHCYGCQAHGDVLDFIQRVKNVDFKQALSELAAYV